MDSLQDFGSIVIVSDVVHIFLPLHITSLISTINLTEGTFYYLWRISRKGTSLTIFMRFVYTFGQYEK